MRAKRSASAGPGAPAAPGGPKLDRPRSVRAHEAVLAAAAEILHDQGFPGATIDAISQRSGVSKATIYNHWPTRTAVASEALASYMQGRVRVPHTDDPRQDVIDLVIETNRFYRSPSGEVYAQLLAASVTDPEGARYFRDLFLRTRRDIFREVWARAVESGAGNSAIDVEDAIDVLFGPLLFRLMAGHIALTDANARCLAEAALAGLGA